MINEPAPGTPGAKDPAHIDHDWVIARKLIDGVRVREVRNIVTANGITTELYRPDWGVVEGTVQQVIHVALRGNAISAWHQHRHRWDFLFVVGGHFRIALFDPREGSPTRGQVDLFHLSPARPMLLASSAQRPTPASRMSASRPCRTGAVGLVCSVGSRRSPM